MNDKLIDYTLIALAAFIFVLGLTVLIVMLSSLGMIRELIIDQRLLLEAMRGQIL